MQQDHQRYVHNSHHYDQRPGTSICCAFSCAASSQSPCYFLPQGHRCIRKHRTLLQPIATWKCGPIGGASYFALTVVEWAALQSVSADSRAFAVAGERCVATARIVDLRQRRAENPRSPAPRHEHGHSHPRSYLNVIIRVRYPHRLVLRLVAAPLARPTTKSGSSTTRWAHWQTPSRSANAQAGRRNISSRVDALRCRRDTEVQGSAALTALWVVCGAAGRATPVSMVWRALYAWFCNFL